jgi:integrase
MLRRDQDDARSCPTASRCENDKRQRARRSTRAQLAPDHNAEQKQENRCRTLDSFAIGAIRLLLLTGARLREILHAKWDYVDFERGLLNLPTSKTGRKSIFLSAAALDVLAALPRLEGNNFIVPGAKDGTPRADLKRPWAAVTQAAGLEGLRLHDLRHSFASVGAGGGLGLPIIGKLLGHATPAMTAKYAHLDNDPMRRAVNQIGKTINAAMNRTPGADDGGVIPLRAPPKTGSAHR